MASGGGQAAGSASAHPLSHAPAVLHMQPLSVDWQNRNTGAPFELQESRWVAAGVTVSGAEVSRPLQALRENAPGSFAEGGALRLGVLAELIEGRQREANAQHGRRLRAWPTRRPWRIALGIEPS